MLDLPAYSGKVFLRLWTLKLTFQVPSIHRQMDKQKGLIGHLSKFYVVIVHHGRVIGTCIVSKFSLH